METTSLSTIQVQQSKSKNTYYQLFESKGLKLRVRKNGGRFSTIRYKNPENNKLGQLTIGMYFHLIPMTYPYF